MSHAIIGTGGHIDHGKTALVRALTGVDTDRLPEEKQRGISIDLGFTRLQLGDRGFGVVDVPGHEDFIRNMLAGATGMDILILVVAGDEGVMPQTREHAAIAALLRTRNVVPVVTKVDLVELEWAELVAEELAELLRELALPAGPVHFVSATTGQGMDGLRGALEALSPAGRPEDDLFRLPLDRAFTVRGTGTVVTGTVWSGALRDGEEVRILPGAGTARVRGLQAHGESVERVTAGQRAAVALAGLDREDAPRGAVLVTDPAWTESAMLTVRLSLLPGTDWSVEQRQRVRVHLGTAEVLARVHLFQDAPLLPGDEGWAQLRLESPLVARGGDRVVVRSYSPVSTIGGGVVVDPAPARQTRLARSAIDRYAAVAAGDPRSAIGGRIDAAGRAGVPVSTLPVLTGATPAKVAAFLDAEDGVVVVEGRAHPVPAAERLGGELRAALEAFHEAEPLEPGMDLQRLRRVAGADANGPFVDRVLADLQRDGAIRLDGSRAAVAGFRPALTERQERIRDGLLDAIRQGGLGPPAEAELIERFPPEPDARAILRLLEADGALVRIDETLLIDRGQRDDLVAAVRGALGGREGLDPGDFRDVIPVSRRYLIPLLEHLDGLGVTVRRDGGRSVPA